MMGDFGRIPAQVMPSFLSEIFPFLYAGCFLLLLWQAFRVMGQGFRASTMPLSPAAPPPADRARSGDRTGRLTIHPELLDADGQLTREDLLTVRFGGENESSSLPGEAS